MFQKTCKERSAWLSGMVYFTPAHSVDEQFFKEMYINFWLKLMKLIS